MNYAKIKKHDIANGPGVRASLYVSGCTHKCPGCFNEEAQDFNYGKLWTKEVEDEFIEHLKNPNIVGVNLLGGEPLQQGATVLHIINRIKEEINKPIWLWTGYRIEDILLRDKKAKIQKDILYACDVVIDGLFIEAEKDLSLKYRGSRNQRVIDMKATLKATALTYGHAIFDKNTIVELEGC